MSGAQLQFSEADLQATVAAYDPARHEAPLVIGHPAHDLPAYGWVQSLSFNEGGIDATPTQVNTDFADMVATGAFKKISASFYAPQSPANPVPGVYYLRHVGFLGAQPPAVKGLRTPQFADTEDGVLTFEFSEFSEPVDTSVHQPQEPTVTPEEKAALEAENTRLKAELAATKAAAMHAANMAFCEAQSGVLPAWREVACATLDHFSALPEPVEFGEAGAKKPLADQFKAMLTSLPAPVQTGESATRDRAAATAPGTPDAQFAEGADPARLAQHQQVLDHMAANKCDYLTAARAVIK